MAVILAALLLTTLIKNPESKITGGQQAWQTPSVIAEKTAAPTTGSENENLQQEKVTRVIDGDTIELETGQKVRYIGINTPETVDPRKPAECFGREASEKNKELVEGKIVELEKDISETDKYQRLLRYVYVDGVLVNDYLVRQGFANASSYPPDVKHQEQFLEAEQEARKDNRGLWAACDGSTLDQSSISQSKSDDCQIKGNISSSGEKIYHTPAQRYYDKTVIDQSKGERWFCTEAEAQEAGWRKSKI